jgi:hypothetical protein
MSNLRDAKPRVKTITLNDGVEREIKFTLNAMAEMEDKYGSVDAAFAEVDKGSIKAVRFVLWAGLLHNENESLTEKQVGNLIDLGSMAAIMESMSEAIVEDLPEQSNEAAGGPNA